MAHKLFAKDDIVWIKKHFLASIKTPRIVEIMEKSTPVYDIIIFLKTAGLRNNFGKDVKKINRGAAENPWSSLPKMKRTSKTCCELADQ